MTPSILFRLVTSTALATAFLSAQSAPVQPPATAKKPAAASKSDERMRVRLAEVIAMLEEDDLTEEQRTAAKQKLQEIVAQLKKSQDVVATKPAVVEGMKVVEGVKIAAPKGAKVVEIDAAGKLLRVEGAKVIGMDDVSKPRRVEGGLFVAEAQPLPEGKHFLGRPTEARKVYVAKEGQNLAIGEPIEVKVVEGAEVHSYRMAEQPQDPQPAPTPPAAPKRVRGRLMAPSAPMAPAAPSAPEAALAPEAPEAPAQIEIVEVAPSPAKRARVLRSKAPTTVETEVYEVAKPQVFERIDPSQQVERTVEIRRQAAQQREQAERARDQAVKYQEQARVMRVDAEKMRAQADQLRSETRERVARTRWAQPAQPGQAANGEEAELRAMIDEMRAEMREIRALIQQLRAQSNRDEQQANAGGASPFGSFSGFAPAHAGGAPANGMHVFGGTVLVPSSTAGVRDEAITTTVNVSVGGSEPACASGATCTSPAASGSGSSAACGTCTSTTTSSAPSSACCEGSAAGASAPASTGTGISISGLRSSQVLGPSFAR